MPRKRGTPNRGWSVSEMKDGRKRFLAAVRDPYGGKPERRRFETRAEAKEWAEIRRAELLLGKKVQRRVAPSSELRDEYLANLRQRGLSDRHLEHVQPILAKFIEAVPDLTDPRAAVLVSRWWADLAGSDLAPATKNIRLRAVRAFLNWDLKRRPSDRTIRDPDILSGITGVKDPRKPKAQFTVAELRTMVSRVDDPYWARFCVRIYLGLRNEGAETTPRENIDLEGRVIEVTEKGAKTRLVRIPQELAHLMGSSLWPKGETIAGPRRIQPGGGRAPWKSVDPRRAMNGSQQPRDLAGFLKRCGIPQKGRTPHSLRHSYTGIMAATGVSQWVLAGWLGHSDASATAGYASEAARYAHSVEDWPRGQFCLLDGLKTDLKTTMTSTATGV